MIMILSLLLSSSSYASSFSETRAVIFGQEPMSSDPVINQEINSYKRGNLPYYEVTASSFVERGIDRLLERATKTFSDKVDYYPRLVKLLHPNGACFTGVWSITDANPYTGFFKNGSKGLFIGRASVGLSETERGDPRAFAFAGKIFPTMNPATDVKTANFFMGDVFLGTQRDRFLDVKYTNNPVLGYRLSLIQMMLKVSKTFKMVDPEPLFRPLYPISEVGLTSATMARTPKFMMLEPDRSNTLNNDVDFRDELDINRNHYRGIKFNIYVNDVSADTDDKNWKKIGNIHLRESTVSYGCDRKLHFSHPRLK